MGKDYWKKEIIRYASWFVQDMQYFTFKEKVERMKYAIKKYETK